MKHKLQGTLFLLLATIIWGSAFVSQSVGMDHIGPFTFQAARCLLAVLILIPLIFLFDISQGQGKQFVKKWANAKLWKAGILCGIPLFLACNLQQVGLVDTDAGKSGFLTAMYIVIVPVISIFLKKKITIMIPISVILAVAGLYCLSCIGVTEISTGDLLTLGCALMFAVQITFVDIFAHGMDALRINTIQSLVCAVLSGIVVIFAETPTWQGILDCALPLAHTGILSMGIAYSLQILGQQKLESTIASLLMSLESVFAVIFSTWLLGETMTIWETIGCILVFTAVILSQIPVKAKTSA
ncbi:MAG: DMT family transporter [Oscillospiraceae bacterium]|nr:DMT family transporter [Oscillospiraceae bacterium]